MKADEKLREHQRQNADHLARSLGRKFEQRVGHSRRPTPTPMNQKKEN